MRIVDVPIEWQDRIRIVAGVTDEDLDRHLTVTERTEVHGLRVPERQIERAASRIAGKLLLAHTLGLSDPAEIQFVKDQDRPFAKVRGQSLFVSFTHSHGLGGAAAGAAPVGLDLERFREIRPGMTRFFLSPDELAAAEGLEIAHPLLHYWSAKEAAFKQTGAFPTMLKVPLRLARADSSGLTFEVAGTAAIVETRVIEGGFLLALATSTA